MAEPAYNNGGLIGFGENSNQNNFASNPLKNKPVKTSSSNPFKRATSLSKIFTTLQSSQDTTVISTPTTPEQSTKAQLRLVEDLDGNKVFIRVASFEENGTIRISGNYLQNYLDFPTYDLSKVKVLDDISFRFFLTIKETVEDSNPLTFTSKSFYDTLISTYQNENPYMVANSVKQEFIVNLVIDTYKNKIEELRRLELSLPIQEVFSGGLAVSKNLFMFSNYNSVDGELQANPTYDIEELVRYVDWVVSKPSTNYDDRLLDTRTIGDWNGPELNNVNEVTNTDTSPEPNEPSTNVTNTSNQQYPPIGRAGYFSGEVVEYDSELYLWSSTTNKWNIDDRGNTDVGGGGPSDRGGS